MSREKVTAEERIAAAKACIEGRISQSEAARRLGVDERSVGIWVKRYTYGGSLAFKEQEHNTVYSLELKMKAIEDYLSGNGSLREIAAKYGLRSTRLLHNWITIIRQQKANKATMM